MLKLLIISLHYPPDNIIAARRSEAYARHFYKFGVVPTIVTDIFEKEFDKKGNWIAYKSHKPNTKPMIEKYATHTVIRLPRIETRMQRIQQFIEKIPVVSPMFTMLLNMLGHFDMHMLGHYSVYKEHLIELLKKESFDYILAIDSPHYHVRLAAELSKIFHIPYICDFRDLYDNNILNKSYKPKFAKRISNSIIKIYFKHWLRNVRLITAASTPLANFYSNLTNRSGYCVTNGYEEGYYNFAVNQKSEIFTISHTGRLYQNQNWSIFAEGVQLFIEKQNPENFNVILAGMRKDAGNILQTIKERIPDEYLKTYSWLDAKDIVRIQLESSILVLASWHGTVGVYSGKVFEYLGARKPIIFAPGDNGGVVDQLLKETKAGISANTPQEVCDFICEKYNEWVAYGKVTYKGIEKEISKYSRQKQVEKAAKLLKLAN